METSGESEVGLYETRASGQSQGKSGQKGDADIVRSASGWVQGVLMKQTMPLDQLEGHLAEIIEKLTPGEEIILTRDDKPVAKLMGVPGETPRPLPGRGITPA